jgi:hypothetical protein
MEWASSRVSLLKKGRRVTGLIQLLVVFSQNDWKICKLKQLLSLCHREVNLGLSALHRLT